MNGGPIRTILAATVAVALTVFSSGGAARADDETTALFASAAAALSAGRAAEAISSFESLADRGVVDAVASYDRGLAYAMRARIGAEVPGDLGRAAHGLEEARDLSHDPKLVDDASRALASIRSEVARRRMSAGDPVEVDPGRSLAHTLASLLAEDTWSAIAVLSSATLALGLFVRAASSARRTRIVGGVASSVLAPILAAAIAMTLAARHDRTRVREAVVVVANARPIDERGITVPGATPLPEGARVEVVDTRGPWSRIRFGSIEARIASSGLRGLGRGE
jgi:hypothetical protein